MRSLIGVPADMKQIGAHAWHCAGDKYLSAITDAMQALPVMIPAMADRIELSEVLDNLDGLLLTGAYSNIEPHHYGASPIEGDDNDPRRDALTLSLLKLAVERRMPVLGICRGFQEANVVFGGSLHQKVHEVPGLNDHREDKDASIDVQYGPSHLVTLQPGGMLASAWPDKEVMVNSVHGQGINRLADGLTIEALAPDGLVEAISTVNDPASGFLLAVQWHPEWQVMGNAFYQTIFSLFAEACEQYALSKSAGTREVIGSRA